MKRRRMAAVAAPDGQTYLCHHGIYQRQRRWRWKRNGIKRKNGGVAANLSQNMATFVSERKRKREKESGRACGETGWRRCRASWRRRGKSSIMVCCGAPHGVIAVNAARSILHRARVAHRAVNAAARQSRPGIGITSRYHGEHHRLCAHLHARLARTHCSLGAQRGARRAAKAGIKRHDHLASTDVTINSGGGIASGDWQNIRMKQREEGGGVKWYRNRRRK